VGSDAGNASFVLDGYEHLPRNEHLTAADLGTTNVFGVGTECRVFGSYERRSWNIQVDKPCPEDPLSNDDGLVSVSAFSSRGVLKRAVANLSRKGTYVGDSLIAYPWGSPSLRSLKARARWPFSRFRRTVRDPPGDSRLRPRMTEARESR
jgi:hypothetical protein